MPEFIPVDPLSLSSLLLQPRARGKELGSATGFVVMHNSSPWLITNRHVFTGRNTETEKVLSSTGAVPDTIRVFHHSRLTAHGQGAWCVVDEPLYAEDGTRRWNEHPRFCIKDSEHPQEPNVDLAALSMSVVNDSIQLYPLDLAFATANVRAAPGLPVSIIGFPFGWPGAALFPIWKTGHIASDPDAYWAPRYFLIDATTRPGMSGSPVVYRSFGIYESTDGSTVVGNATRLLGVYSGRIRDDAEIGIVWRPDLILEAIRGETGRSTGG